MHDLCIPDTRQAVLHSGSNEWYVQDVYKTYNAFLGMFSNFILNVVFIKIFLYLEKNKATLKRILTEPESVHISCLSNPFDEHIKRERVR